MVRSRLFEEAIAGLWHDGLISGEMHLGTGEEAIIAGVVSQLLEGDRMALDHRGTSPMLLRGVDPGAILREVLGMPDGLCRGMGGHMHLFSKPHLSASSGIVGSAGPAAAGFALSAQLQSPGSVAVAFFGEGALNQGMMMESLNLASVWKLPVLFICKDDGWSITESSERVTGGTIIDRAEGFGIPTMEVDGGDLDMVWASAEEMIERGRSGEGPSFLRARCVHLEGHFLGFQLLRITRNPLKEMPGIAAPLTASMLKRGGSVRERAAGLRNILSAIRSTFRDPRGNAEADPIARTRSKLGEEGTPVAEIDSIEQSAESEIAGLVSSAITELDR